MFRRMVVNVEYVVTPGKNLTPSNMRLVVTLEMQLSLKLMLKVLYITLWY